jgi:hypothetical protein
LGPVIYHLPVLKRFRWPFKLIYFAGFFQCLAAALVLTLFGRRWQRIAIAVFVINWTAVFCFLPIHAWRTRKYHVPLQSPWQESLKDGRYLVVSQGSVRTVSMELVERNYSGSWGLDNLLGYEPLVLRLNATLLVGKPLSEWETNGGNYMGDVDPALRSHLKLWSVK